METNIVQPQQTGENVDGTAKETAMETSSESNTEEAAEIDDETSVMTIMRDQPGDAGVLITVKQNQVSFTGHPEQVNAAYNEVRFNLHM